MLVDASLIALLLVVGHLLRARIDWLQRGLVPSSMVAGLLGLIGGPQCLGWLKFSSVEGAANGALAISRWPAILVIAVFGTLLMGHRSHGDSLSSRLRRVRPVLNYNLAAEFGQFALALILGALLLQRIAPSLPSQFAVMLPAGFAGGAATSTVFAQGFEAQGWRDALSIGFAFATLGQAAAILGGMLLINLGVRRGWVALGEASPDQRRRQTAAFVDDFEQHPACYATTNPLALDPLAWHLALLGAVFAMTFALDASAHFLIPGKYLIPQFSLAMLVGAALQAALDRLGFGRYVDPLAMRRLGSAAADILIVCSIASIRLSVVGQYAGAIAALAIIGTIYSLAVFLLGRWVFREYWFERSLFAYGWMTGVVGTSVALVRVVDPRQESAAVEDYGTAFLVLGPLEMILYPVVIWACAAGRMGVVGVALALLAAGLFVLARRPASPRFASALRPRVAETVLDASPTS